MAETKWIKRWNTWIAPKPSKPGVWRRKEGGHLVRGRARDPRTGKIKQVRMVLMETDALVAFELLQRELRTIREGIAVEKKPSIAFGEFAATLFEEKIVNGEIKSAAGRDKWGIILEHHVVPQLGSIAVDKLRRTDMVAWRNEAGAKIARGDYSPHTVNGWIDVLRVLTKAAVARYELPRDPMAGIKKFDTSEHCYTEEEPNSCTHEELALFLATLKEKYPQHYAFACLGFFLGQRPSTLRPLRRKGETPDFDAKTGVLLIRRSQVKGDEVMETTKTKIRQKIVLPPELVTILEQHVEQLPEGPMRDSDLLFPSETGGHRSRSCLDRPFNVVRRAIGLKKKITPKAMRRSFQDLARAAEVKDIVTRAISGHATETMQHHYSTVAEAEKGAAISKVIHLAGVTGGLHGGLHARERKKAVGA